MIQKSRNPWGCDVRRFSVRGGTALKSFCLLDKVAKPVSRNSQNNFRSLPQFPWASHVGWPYNHPSNLTRPVSGGRDCHQAAEILGRFKFPVDSSLQSSEKSCFSMWDADLKQKSIWAWNAGRCWRMLAAVGECLRVCVWWECESQRKRDWRQNSPAVLLKWFPDGFLCNAADTFSHCPALV